MNELDRILKSAEVEHDKLKHPYVGTEHLLLALLKEENDLTDKLKEYKLTYNRFKKKLKEIIGEGSNKSPYILYTPMLRKVLSIANESKDIDNKVLFNAILKANEGIAIRIIETLNIDISKININNNYLEIDTSNIISNRDKEINEIFQILIRKNKCNPLLIGEAGVGKTAIVEEIQRRLLIDDVPSYLKGYNIINVDISSLVAGTKYRGDFESKINELLKSVENTKNILFIDEIHTLVHAGGAEGAISAGDIIKPYLARGKIKCIGATTMMEYHKYFEIDEALNRRFQTIIINEPDEVTTIDILNKLKYTYEKYHKVKISNELSKEIVKYANKYLINKKNPDKSIELLDSCCTNAKFREDKEVNIDNLYNIFKMKYDIDFSNKNIKAILDNSLVLLSSKDNINKIKYLKNTIYVDGDKYKSNEDIYNLLGNPNLTNSNYLLKRVIDSPIGIIAITNYNYNQLLKEFIFKIINNRKLIDNYGNNINLSNYIIVIEKNDEDISLGFTKNKFKINNVKFIELDEKILQSAI